MYFPNAVELVVADVEISLPLDIHRSRGYVLLLENTMPSAKREIALFRKCWVSGGTEDHGLGHSNAIAPMRRLEPLGGAGDPPAVNIMFVLGNEIMLCLFRPALVECGGRGMKRLVARES